jgi:ribosomal protein S18 acetylase RimI-like enzyme
MADPAIRPARPADVPAVREVAAAAWHEAHAPIVGAERVEAVLEDWYDPEGLHEAVAADAPFLVAEREGDVVGFAAGRRDEDDPGCFHLGRIYVHPDRWGEGVGTALLDAVVAAARERDADRLRLGVMADNDRARGFYEDRGFERVGDRRDERLGVRAVLYERPI